MNLSTKQKWAHRHREQNCGYQGWGQGERWAKHFVLVDAALIFRMNKNGPTV